MPLFFRKTIVFGVPQDHGFVDRILLSVCSKSVFGLWEIKSSSSLPALRRQNGASAPSTLALYRMCLYH